MPGGKNAVTGFRGTVERVGAVWEAMLRGWLPKSGMQLDERPFFTSKVARFVLEGECDPIMLPFAVARFAAAKENA